MNKQNQQNAINTLLEILRPNDVIYTNLRYCSRSGMSRSISLHYIDEEKNMRDISGLAAKAMKDKIDEKHGGIKIGGCGMDMGFALVYNLGCYLWPNGTPEPHSKRNGLLDSSGGYALKQQWI